MVFLSSLVPVAVTNGEVIVIVVVVAIPLAAIAFIANAGNAFRSIGKGGLSVEFDSDADQELRDTGGGESAGVQVEELRQMLEAKAYRQQARGETPLDVDAELERLLAEQRRRPDQRRPGPARRGPPAGGRTQRAARSPGQGAARRRGRGGAPAARAREPRAIGGRAASGERPSYRLGVMTDDNPIVELDDLLVRPGTYFNPQTEVVVVVDDSTSIDQEVFNMEAFEGADWVRVSDEVPVDNDALDTAMERFQSMRHAPVGVSVQATELEPDSDDLVEEEEELEPDPDPDEEP